MGQNGIHQVSDLASLIGRLKTDLEPEGTYWFRGQSNIEWGLLPSLARSSSNLEKEGELISRFKQNATLLISNTPQSEWEWMTIMQHHSVPTRLLDWTESPLIGLYFAVAETLENDGALWILKPIELNMKANINPTNPAYIPSFEDDWLTNYSPSALAREKMTHLNPIAVIGNRNTARMQAQLGAFTIIHRDPKAIEEVGDGQQVLKYKVPAKVKKELRKDLKLLGIGKFQLFPELQSLGEMLREV